MLDVRGRLEEQAIQRVLRIEIPELGVPVDPTLDYWQARRFEGLDDALWIVEGETRDMVKSFAVFGHVFCVDAIALQRFDRLDHRSHTSANPNRIEY